ncbi:hypothetical protein CMEL01_10145 [Colletotrichum melonis]|uniref:Uncharacterized protein n=1 Tax=Colletotrichum melonis TaxID=1209925 RepID=A0AAI9TUH0_9PEZI|nr:hypothetical protein CMEL01_10145 [Colletotrichum melonis]
MDSIGDGATNRLGKPSHVLVSFKPPANFLQSRLGTSQFSSSRIQIAGCDGVAVPAGVPAQFSGESLLSVVANKLTHPNILALGLGARVRIEASSLPPGPGSQVQRPPWVLGILATAWPGRPDGPRGFCEGGKPPATRRQQPANMPGRSGRRLRRLQTCGG